LQGLVFRPPSEADSLIIQATLGCSNNTCTFCYSYKQKKFQIRPLQDVLDDLLSAQQFYGNLVRKIFLADGDALVMKNEDLLEILNFSYSIFPRLERVGIYACAPNVLNRKDPLKELIELRKAGLKIIYLGIESGSDEILKSVNKKMTSEDMYQACKYILEAGIELSVTIIIGLGGRAKWKENAIETGKLLSRIGEVTTPESIYYVGALSLIVPSIKRGYPVDTPLAKKVERGEFQVLNSKELLEEMRLLIENINVKNKIVFRSNHASNYLPIGGDLPEDKERLLKIIDSALKEEIQLRPEFLRGL
ncbi:MAG: radical SAM protein, partial [Candidatus Helarchaeota archaeon]